MFDFIAFFGGTFFIVLVELVLLYFIVRAIRTKIHWSFILILIGLIIKIIFSISSKTIIYFSMNNHSSIQEYMPWSSMMGGVALAGFIIEIIGFCIFLSFILKKYTSEKNV